MNPETTPADPLARPRALALAAVGCAVAGPCCGPTLAIAAVLALVALGGARGAPSSEARSVRGPSVVALVLVLVQVAVYGGWLWFVLEILLA